MSEKPRWRLRRERVRREWGYGTALERIAATAHTRGIPPELLDLDESQLKRWENGKTTPRKLSIWLLSETYALPPEQLDLPPLPFRFSPPAVEPTLPRVTVRYADASERLVSSHDGESDERDVKRRQFLVAAAAFLADGAFGEQLALDLADTAAMTPAPSTAVDAATIRDTTRAFRDLDNRLGGGSGLAMVTDYLDRTVQPLLRETHDATAGRGLFSASAELAQLAGWMAYDTQAHDVARRYLDRALQYAIAAADVAFSAELLAGMSHQAIHLGQLEDALELALAAQASAARAQLPALQTESFVMEAHSHALSGDAKACARAIHRAEQVFDRAGSTPEPEWLRYFDEAYLAAKLAHCFRDLGQWHHAEHFARAALAMNAGLARTRTFNTAILATTYVSHDRDQAYAVGVEAITLASRLQSGRSVQYIRDLEARLTGRYPHDPVVAGFGERVRATFGTA